MVKRDIPREAEESEKGGREISHRGELYYADDIRERLNMRDFMDKLRASGIDTGGPPALSQSDRQLFASHLDTLLARES